MVHGDWWSWQSLMVVVVHRGHLWPLVVNGSHWWSVIFCGSVVVSGGQW